MIVQQKVHSADPGDLEPVDGVPRVLVGTEEIFDTGDGQEGLEPLVFVGVAGEEADVAVGGFVAALVVVC